MKISFETQRFVKELGRSAGAVAESSPLAALGGVLIVADDQGVKICGTNHQTGIDTVSCATVAVPGRALLPAKKLLEMLKILPGREATLSVKDNHWAEIVSGKVRYTLCGQDPASFPVRRETSQEHSFAMDAAVLIQMISEVQAAVGNDEAKAHLNGLHVSVEGGLLRLAATDTKRLITTGRSCPDAEHKLPAKGVIWPKRGVSELTKAFTEKNGALTVCHDDASVSVSDGVTTVHMQLLAGDYPDFRSVIPKAEGEAAVFLRKELADACRRGAVVSDAKTASVKLALSSGACVLRGQSAEIGEAVEEIDVRYTGDSVELNVNPGYLCDALSAIEADEVQLYAPGATRPITVRTTENPEFVAVVMPLRF